MVQIFTLCLHTLQVNDASVKSTNALRTLVNMAARATID